MVFPRTPTRENEQKQSDKLTELSQDDNWEGGGGRLSLCKAEEVFLRKNSF